MKIHQHIPRPPLRRFVKSIICYEGYTGNSKYEIILPDESPQLIIELDGNPRFVTKNMECVKGFSMRRNSWIRGLFTRPVIYQSEHNASTLSIQFELCGLSRFLCVHAEELTNNVFDTELILGNKIIELREKVIEHRSFDERVETIEKFLWQRLADTPVKNSGVEHIVSLPGFNESTLDKISKEMRYSKKHIIAMFRDAIGVTPKKLQILRNVNKSLLFFNNLIQFPTARTAVECNHFDQSHFIKNFKLITSMTPQQYLNQHRTYPHVIALD